MTTTPPAPTVDTSAAALRQFAIDIRRFTTGGGYVPNTPHIARALDALAAEKERDAQRASVPPLGVWT